jgi:hypothetical protein
MTKLREGVSCDYQRWCSGPPDLGPFRTRSPEWPLMALNVSPGTARFRQLSEAMWKTYARREFFSL